MAIKTAPREMTKIEGRKVFRLIDDNYDDANSRYIGDATDAKLAKELGVPRKWVSDTREQHFGPDGRNEEMDKIKCEIGRAQADAEKASRVALEAAEKAEAAAKHCATLKAKIDAVEASVGPAK